MIINTSQIKLLINNKAIPTTVIEEEFGLDRSTISRIRSGKRSLENLKLGTVQNLQKQIDLKYKISYDYTEILADFTEDIKLGLLSLNGYCYAIRGAFREDLGKSPVVDYCFNADEVIADYGNDSTVTFEFIQVQKLLDEMKYYNSLF